MVAEGVEDQATLSALADLGSDLAQGYFMCRPIPAVELERWYRALEEDRVPRRLIVR